MKVSVVIPCYNAERYLAQTIGSVLDQTKPVAEVVIVDDGSTDGSLAIAHSFATACATQIQVHSERSANAARTRNIGASLVSGEAVLFLDADDLLAPDALASMVTALETAPGNIAACAWRRLELVDERWVSRRASCAPRKPDQDALAAWLTGWYHPPCAVLWSKEAFVRTGGWDEAATLNDDGDIMMRALVSGISLVETSAGTAYYRKLPHGQASLSGQRNTFGGLAGRIAIIEKIARMLEEQGRIARYRAPISQAFALIAADASGRYAGLCQQARANSRHYAPSIWRSAMLASANRSPDAVSAARIAEARPLHQSEVIRYGLDRAHLLLAHAPEASPPASSPSRASPVMPTVSVIIPVYNRARLLARALDSVIAQTFTDFEVLIVDDCSQDDPAAVVDSYRDPRLRFLRQAENQGVAAARNRGLRESRASLVAFLDDDDEWFPDKLALQVELLRNSPPDIGLIYTGVETVSDMGIRSLQNPTARGDLYRELLVKNILHGGGSNIMIRRNVVTDVGFFDEKLPAIEDYDYWLRICRRYKVACISTPLVRYNDYRAAPEGAGNSERRSLMVKANLEARAQIYRKHGAQMRKAGVAHLFLADSARRHLAAAGSETNNARRLGAQAFLLAPASWDARNTLLETWVPLRVRKSLGNGRRMFEGAASVWNAK